MFIGTAVAQSGRQHRPLYDLDGGAFHRRGWHFAPGVAYAFPSAAGRENERLIATEGGAVDTLYAGEFSAAGKPGIYLEVGRTHLMDALFILDCIDYGIGLKQLRGREDFSGTMFPEGGVVEVENRGDFSQMRGTAFVNFSNIHQLSDRSFLQNSLGFNTDYRFIDRVTYNGPTTGMLQGFPPDFTCDIHYKLGFGWRPESGRFVIPTLETPLLSVVQFQDGRSTTQWFSTRYRPIIFTLRFILLDKRKSPDCVGASRGGRKHELFDPSMRRKK